MAADTEVVRITYKELEEIATYEEEKELERNKSIAKEEAKKKREEERKKKRPVAPIYQPPHRSKKDADTDTCKDVSVKGDPIQTAEESWDEDLLHSSADTSSKESSVEKELKNVTSGMQGARISEPHKPSRRSEENRRPRAKKPEIQRYVPKGKLLGQQQDTSREGSTDWDDETSSPSPNPAQTPSPGPGNLPHTPSPRKIDRNLQVTVVNDKAGGDVVTSDKTADISESRSNENVGFPKGRGQGQSYSRGRGQRLNQRSNKQTDGRGNQVGNRNNTREQDLKSSQYRTSDSSNKSEKVKQEISEQTSGSKKEVKPEQEMYIVPSRPSTIGQEADRMDTVPVGTDKNEQNTRERGTSGQSHYTRSGSVPITDKQELRFKKTPNKSKSRSFDKLNKADRWEEEDGFYADPENLGTMVFERSRSSEQLNLSARNTGKPPMPRSGSGSAIRGGQRKYAGPGMRKRTDSFSSDISAGTGSDWSTEELDFDKDIDTGSKIDWNEDVERELALQVQDETQKMNEWFERQELGLSQKDSLKDRTNNAMTSSIPGYQSGFLAKSASADMTPEKSNTLPFTRRKHNEEPRGRQHGRRGSLGFRSRDSSVSSVQSVQSVHSVQSAYSGDGRRRRRRRRKSSGGSQKNMHGGSRGGSMEQINIQVTCGSQGNRREVKVDEYSGRKPGNYNRQNSSEGQNRGGGKSDGWRERGYRGDHESGRDTKGQFRGDKGRSFDKKGSQEHLDNSYHSKDRWAKDERQQQRGPRDRQRQDSGGSKGGGGQGQHGYRRGEPHMDNREEGRGQYRGKEQFDKRRGQRHDSGGHERDRRDRDDYQRGHRDDNQRGQRDDYQRGHPRDNRDRFGDRRRDFRQEENKYGDFDDGGDKNTQQTQRGGLLHLPSQQPPAHEHNQQPSQKNTQSGPHNNWSRGHTPEKLPVHGGRERQNSGGNHHQRTLFDPNNPSKPIVIDEPKPKLEFKDTDSYGSSPHSPQYMGPQPPDMYNRGYGPFYPPGYGYGYNMPQPHPGMMPMQPPPGMFYGYQGPPPPEQFRGGEEGYGNFYQGGVEGEQQAMAGRSRSQSSMMAEQMLREAVPIDKQLTSLISRRIGGEDTLKAIYGLRRELLVRCERIILLDPGLANDKNVEQMLWKSVFHQMVELIRKQLAEDSLDETKMSLHKILDEGTIFYESLLEKLQKTFNFDLNIFLDPNVLPPENLNRYIKLALLSTQRTLICLGDIARYKEQNNDGGKVNYAKARNQYTKAQQIAPKNGRPYNQLAILALYTKHKLDAVYFYMRSLQASNPFLTARESLMSLFNEARKKAEVTEKQRFEEKKKQESLRQHHNVRQHRVEIWINPHDGSSSQSKVDDNYDEDLSKLDTIQLNKRFVLSYLNIHGKLFTKIGMEMFPDSCGQMLQEFKLLLKDNAIGPQRLLQLMAMNMFAIENTALKDESLESTYKSLHQQHSVQMGLDMFGILVEQCSQLLETHIRSADYPGRMFSRELEELVPGVKIWTDWMICHTDLWNPPPQVRDPNCGPQIDVWSCTAILYNILMEMDTTNIVKFHTDRQDGYEAVILPEDTMMSGFVPLLGKATINTFVSIEVDKEMAKDCLRVEKLRVFGAYLYGMEQPMLAYSGKTKKYYSVAPSDGFENNENDKIQPDSLTEDDDIVIEDEEIVTLEGVGDDEHVHELKARKEELQRRMAEKKKIQENRERVLETNRHHCIEIEIRPIFLIPDTNCFIDHLPSLRKLITDKQFTVVIPLVVINELDGLAQGSKQGQFESEDHARKVKTRAQHTIDYLEREFEQKNSRLKALTSKGTVMETISFRSEETDPSGNNDDLILSCCTYYCKDKARDYMPKHKDTPVKLMREVVLLTEDRNLRLKAHTHNVPVKDIPAFLKWSSTT